MLYHYDSLCISKVSDNTHTHHSKRPPTYICHGFCHGFCHQQHFLNCNKYALKTSHLPDIDACGSDCWATSSYLRRKTLRPLRAAEAGAHGAALASRFGERPRWPKENDPGRPPRHSVQDIPRNPRNVAAIFPATLSDPTTISSQISPAAGASVRDFQSDRPAARCCVVLVLVKTAC